MPVRNIQFLKVVQIILHFRAFHYFIPHANEDSLYFFQRNRIRMAVPHHILLRRKRHVDDFLLHLFFADSPLHLFLALFQDLLDRRSCLIHKLANLRPLLRGNILHAFEDRGKFSLLSKELHAYIVQFFRHISCFNGLKSLILDAL